MNKRKKVAIIIPYFGNFPNYFNYWLKSAQASGLQLILSENVSHSIKITPNVKFLNLNDIDSWIREIKSKVVDDKFDRKDETKAISKYGYDMSNSAQIIRRIYSNEEI